MDIKIRYTWKRKSDGEIQQFTDYLQNLETGELLKCPYFLHPEYDLIARDLWIGIQDFSKVDIFQNDIVEYLWKSGGGRATKTTGVVNQQGAEWFCGHDRFVDDGDEQVIEVAGHKVIGNIHTKS